MHDCDFASLARASQARWNNLFPRALSLEKFRDMVLI